MEELTDKLAERTADLQRLQAEYVNYKRRVDRDRDLARKVASRRVLKDLLSVLDDIRSAREHERAERRLQGRRRRDRAGDRQVRAGVVRRGVTPSTRTSTRRCCTCTPRASTDRPVWRSCSRATGSVIASCVRPGSPWPSRSPNARRRAAEPGGSPEAADEPSVDEPSSSSQVSRVQLAGCRR